MVTNNIHLGYIDYGNILNEYSTQKETPWRPRAEALPLQKAHQIVKTKSRLSRLFLYGKVKEENEFVVFVLYALFRTKNNSGVYLFVVIYADIKQMNTFYKQPKLVQWIEAVLLLLLGLLPALPIIEKGYTQPMFYLLYLVYIPIAQFAFTPFFRLTGVYTYYSPMLLGYAANKQQIDLHSGTSFDYLFVMRHFKPGTEIRNRLLLFHLDGLINLIHLIENKSIPETVTIVGTSYFFNNRTMAKMGFEVENPSFFYRVNLFVNFIDLYWMYSLSRGTFSIPKLWEAKKARITGDKLIENKKNIVALYERLNAKTTT